MALEISIMIEGQNGLNWPRWQNIAHAVEDLGFTGLYRSDHFTNARPPDKDSLELWVSLTWLAGNTKRIQFGPLVSPISFRNPTHTARMAAAVDDLSGGRLVLGLGAGWQKREHTNFGWNLLEPKQRFDRFEEGLHVISNLLASDQPVTFQGEYFELEDAILLPRPQRHGGPPILIGGNGKKRTLGLVARYAAEWNAIFIPSEEFSRLNAQLEHYLQESGRKPASVKRSLMTGLIFGKDGNEVEKKILEKYKGDRDADELRALGMFVGEASQIKEQLLAYETAGVQQVMLQWLDLDDMDGLKGLAKGIIA